jgi:Undecaprenyl-phosphate glucose phosphotransferase
MQQNGNSRFLFLFDLSIIYICFFFVYIYYEGFTSIPLKGNMLMVTVVFLWFIISVNSDVCKVNRQSRCVKTVERVLVAYSILSVAVIAMVAIFGEFRPNDKLLLFPLFYAFLTSVATHLIFLITIKHFIKNGYQYKLILLIGEGEAAKKVINEIQATPELGYRLHGVLSDEYDESFPKGLFLGKTNRFSEIVNANKIDTVIIAKTSNKKKILNQMVEKCEEEGVRVHIVPDFYHILRNRTVIDSLGDIPLIGIRPEPLNILSNRIIKRIFDIVIASTALVVLSPLFILCTILIKIFSAGPVLFRQTRIGANNDEFEIYKFRSMIIQEQEDSDSIWTTSDDKRITKIGKIMRTVNMDELPQLWNVLLGNMSIVGPRPERKHFIEKFKDDIPYYNVRHLVKSGITGWAQANGWRGDTSIKKRVQYDIYYLENWSFWLDLKIIFLTLFNRKAWKNAAQDGAILNG